MVELARFMVDSLSFRNLRRRCTKYWVNGATCCVQYLDGFFWTRLSWIQLCYRWIVYSWQASTVTDGVCKHNTSNDPFSRCKSVHEMVTDKKWWSQHTVWLQVHKWTESENSILVCYVCVVTLQDYTTDTCDDMTTMSVFHTEHINTNTWVCLVLFILCLRVVTLHTAPHGSSPSCVRHSSHPHALMMCAVLPWHWSLHSLHPLPHAPLVAPFHFQPRQRSTTDHGVPKRCWTACKYNTSNDPFSRCKSVQ